MRILRHSRPLRTRAAAEDAGSRSSPNSTSCSPAASTVRSISSTIISSPTARALQDLLPHLVEWQKRNGYAVSLSCEATLNIARTPEILALMREAAFDTIFCGIETPEPDALEAIYEDAQYDDRRSSMRCARINDHGMEVVSGIILGLDTDTPETGARIFEFLENRKIPLADDQSAAGAAANAAVGPAGARGRAARRRPLRESNVDFLMPYDGVLAMWRGCMERAYDPKTLFRAL